jgi:hypothetical protein
MRHWPRDPHWSRDPHSFSLHTCSAASCRKSHVCHSKRWRSCPCQNLERWGTAPLSLEPASDNNSSQNCSVAIKLNDCSAGRTTEGLAVRCMAGAIYVHFCPQNCEKRLLASSRLSVRPQGIYQLPHNGFSWNLIFEYISKICRENSSFVKISQ